MKNKTLSDKIISTDLDVHHKVIPVNDVREFIKKLKEKEK